jgi:hypothetical protein
MSQSKVVQEEDVSYLPDNFAQMPFPIQPNSQSDAVYSDLMREERIANLISQLDPENQLEEIGHRLRGLKKDRKNGVWVPMSPLAPKVPELLIANFMSFLTSIMNQSTSFSNYDAGEINRMMHLIIEHLIDDLESNSEMYGLKDNYAERTRIAIIIAQNCFTVFKRAKDGMEARRFFSALRVEENMSPQPQQQPKKFLDHFKLW